MEINDAVKAAQQIIDAKIPGTLKSRDTLLDEAGDNNMHTAMETIEDFLRDLTDKVEGLRDLVYELGQADKDDLEDYTVNVQAAAEEVRDILQPVA